MLVFRRVITQNEDMTWGGLWGKNLQVVYVCRYCIVSNNTWKNKNRQGRHA